MAGKGIIADLYKVDKITDLTFLQATSALYRDRCKAIENERGQQYWKNVLGILSFRGRHLSDKAGSFHDGVHLTPEDFLGKWRLIGVKPRKELRTLRYWVVVDQGGNVTFWKETPPPPDVREKAQHVIARYFGFTYIFPEEG